MTAMERICLVLPTDRACEQTIAAIGAEAQYAADHFDVEVHLLILDRADEQAFAIHAAMLHGMSRSPRVIVHHVGEDAQREFLRRVISAAGAAKPDLVLDLMLPAGVSYGARTNRAFLYAAALGCESIHRRDCGTGYQTVRGRQVYPIHHELVSIGRRAIDAAEEVSEADESVLGSARAHRPVALVGGSFIGELPERGPADEPFPGAGTEPFVRDHSILTVVDPTRIDMCNVSFHSEVYERVPLPPAVDTIGTDRFLIHLIECARLPGVLHNRNVVNHYSAAQRAETESEAYQLRLAKFRLSAPYLDFIYERMAEAGPSMLDEYDHVRPDAVVEFARLSADLDRAENVDRLRDEAQADIEDFALLTELWQGLVQASKATGI